MEVLGIVGAVAGLATNAVQLTQAIRDLISGIKSAPKNLIRLGEELNVLQMVLSEASNNCAIRGDSNEKGMAIMALQDCVKELEQVYERVKPWQQKARESRGISIASFQMHREEKELKAILEGLERRKMTICMALMVSISSTRSRKTGSGRKLERQPMCQPMVDLETVDVNMVEATQAFRKVLSDAIEDGAIKVLEIMERNENNVDLCYLQQLDRNVAEELWKLDLPHLNKIKKIVLAQNHKEVLRSLYTFDYNQDYSEIIDANATCEWIPEDPVYRAWKQETSSQILHVVGKPGQGKTVLAKYITRRLSDEGSIKGIHSRALYYFCNSRKHAQETASSILQAMIHQILEDIPSLVETFLKSCGTMSNHPFSTTVSKGGWSLQALCKAFLDMIAASKLELVFCVIDALDENDRDSVEEFLRMLVTGLSNMDSNGTNLKVLITSRPEDYIMDELTEHPHIRIAVQTVQKDIQTVVQGRLVKLRKRLRLKLQEEADLQAELVRRAEGLFLWVTLVLGILEKARGITTKRLWELVRELPIGLNDLYDKILSKIASESEEGGNCDLVRQILTWAVLAARPLTLAELRIALAVKLNTTSIDENEVIRNIREVETLCGAFVEIVPAQISAEVHESSESIQLEDEEHSADTVRLIHQSAKDYLLDRLFKLKEPISVFRIEPPKGHLEISLQCLTYLLFDEFDDKRKQSGLHGRTATEAFGDDEDGSYEAMVLQDKLERHPFLKYASVHWPFHVRQISPMEGQEIIHLACKFLCSPVNFQNSLRVRSYLKDPNLRYSHSPSALNFAASLGLYHVVEDLLKDHRIDINEPDDLGEATLSAVAITAGDHLSEKPRIVQLLIDRGARLTCCPCHGRSPLQWAITNSGHLELCKVFLNNGAASETFDIGQNGIRSFHYAAMFNRVDLIVLLLDHAANNIEVTTDGGITALHIACQYGHLDTIKILINRGANIETVTTNNLYTPLHMAVMNNQRDATEFLLLKGAILEARATGVYNTAIHFAAHESNLDIMKLLVQHGVDVNATTDILEQTPLHIAVQQNSRECVEFLLDNGANIETYALGPMQATALMYAIKETAEMVQLLLDRGANVNAPVIEENLHALHYAVMVDSDDILKLIILKVSNIDPISKSGASPLHIACTFGQVETAKILIDAGAALNMRDNDGDTPMLLAVRTHEHEIVELLLERGADAEILNNDGETALICAANEGHINTIQTLLRRRVKVDPNILGEHMLAVAMASQDIEAIRMHIMSTKPGDPSAIRRYWNLLQDYSMPDLLSKTVLPLAAKLFSARGSTLLHWACLAGRCQLAEQLLDLDIPYMAVDHNGWTPWHIATRGQGWWLPRMEDVSKKLECKAGVPATLPFQRLPTRWINVDCDDSSRRFQLSEEGLVAELLSSFSGNLDKSPAVVADVCVWEDPETKSFYFEIEVLEVGSRESFDIGFSLEIARLNRHLGIDQYGWSYSACNGKTRHRNEWQQYGYQGHPKCAKGDIIGCGINFKAGIGGTIFYTRNGVFLGDAFTNVTGPLYPHLSSTSPGFKFRTNFGGRPYVYMRPQEDEGVDMGDEN